MTDLVLKDKTVIISSQYLPLRELFSAIITSGRIYMDGDELWRKQTLANRTFILGANGEQTLSIPIQHTGGVKTPVKQMRISYSQPWSRVHKGALFSAYNTSPFFTFFRDELFEIFDAQPEYLHEFNLALFKCLLGKLKYTGEILEELPQGEYADLRGKLTRGDIKESYPTGETYNQVFSSKFPFSSYLSALDCIANTGTV